MKTQQEIRSYISDLRAALAQPCCCGGTDHATECYLGSLQIEAQLAALLWALGECPAMQTMVDELAQRVKWIGVG